MAQLNLERAKRGQPPLSLRRLAQETGISQSVLVSLHTGRSRRIDYATIDRLLSYFNHFFPLRMDDLFAWEAAKEQSHPAAIGM